MGLDDFTSFTNTIIDYEFPVKNIPIIYCQSIKLQVDEVNSDKHLKMFFEEFVEAMARVVDRLSPFPENDDPIDWPAQLRQDQHLSEKLINVIPLFFKSLKDEYKNVRDKYTLPKKEDGYYQFDLANQFYSIYPKGLHK